MNGLSECVRRGVPWLVVAICLVAAFPASGAPLFGEVVSIGQPDGTTLAVRVWGDEFYGVGETLDGYTVVRDPKSGMHCYAELSSDGRELVSTGVPAAQTPPGGLARHIRVSEDAAREQARASREAFERQTYEGPLAPPRAAPTGPTTGVVQGITLIVDFSDDPGSIAPTMVDSYLNQVGFTGYGDNGSVRDYYYDVSNHLLQYTNYVPAAYYRASHPKSYYTDPSISYGQRARELISEALTALNNAGFDFSQYDVDDNGIIDAMNCFYAGNVWNNWAEGLWPHSGSMHWCADGVCTNRYQITNMGSQLVLGTFCHENGHMLMGWPDLYDYDYDSRGVGVYCLMGYGGSGGNPIQPCAYMKFRAGWASVTLPVAPQVGLSVPSSGNVVFKFNHPTLSNEYYLIENRQQAGRDASLPDNGLAIWHIDTDGSNNNQQQTPGSHYLVTLVQADGRWDLENNRNSGDATDLYAAPQYTACTPSTNPNTDWWSGNESGLAFANVGTSGSVMTFDFGQTPPPRPLDLVAEAGELSVSLTWAPVPISDLDHYRIERDTTALFSGGTVSMTSAGTAYVDGPLTGGREYFYRVFAVNLDGLESLPSDTASAIALVNSPPSVPTGLATWGGGGAAELRWTANPEIDIARYRVVRDSTLAFAHPETLGFPTGTVFVDTTCPLNRSYWYYLVAEDLTGLLSGPTAPVAGIAVSGQTVYVDDSNTGPQMGTYQYPYRTIPAGLSHANAGDAVMVLPGSYDMAVQLVDGVPLIGMRGAASTTTSLTLSAAGVGRSTVLKGFRVDVLGLASTALDCSGCRLIVEDSEFAHATSAAVSCRQGGAAVIRRNSFIGNQSGISCADSSAPFVRSNTFEGNSFAHILTFGTPGPLVGGSLAEANDFVDRGLYMIFNGGPSPVAAEYNYWGDDCVNYAWFSGLVDYSPWTDETHTLTFDDCWTGVLEGEIPLAAYAGPAFPNPSRHGTSVAFGLPEPGGAVSLRVYNVSGRLVRTLVDGSLPAGRHAATWDGKDDSGAEVSSGVYFYRLEAPGFEGQGRLVVLK